MESFYVYLPSNVSSGSRAKKFSTTLSSELNLDGNWMVSLAEMNYTSSTYTFRGERMKVWLEKDTILQEKKFAGVAVKIISFYNYPGSITIAMNYKGGKYEFINMMDSVSEPNRALLSISLSESLAKKTGLKTFYNDFELPAVSSKVPFIKDMTVDDYWIEEWKILTEESFTVSLNRRKISTNDELIEYIQKTVLEKLNVIKLEFNGKLMEFVSKKLDLRKTNDKLTMVVEKGYHVEFLDGLHFVLGFTEKILNTTSTAEYPPHLNRDTDSMFIYSNIVNYSRVGHSESPILRIVPFQSDGETGTTKTWASLNLIYKQVRLKSIRTIDVEIRTESGEYFPFVDNSISQLVLHFKKT